MGSGANMVDLDTMRDIITRNRAWYCLDCGKCSAVCPITRWEKRCYTTPRLLVEKAVDGRIGEFLDDPLFWSCLTCKRCSELCPSEVSFSEFLRDLRGLARRGGRSGDCTHGDAIQTWGRIMTRPELHPDRLGWLSLEPSHRQGDHGEEKALRVSNRSD